MFTCTNGYQLTGGSQTIVCTQSGLWNSTIPTCVLSVLSVTTGLGSTFNQGLTIPTLSESNTPSSNAPTSNPPTSTTPSPPAPSHSKSHSSSVINPIANSNTQQTSSSTMRDGREWHSHTTTLINHSSSHNRRQPSTTTLHSSSDSPFPTTITEDHSTKTSSIHSTSSQIVPVRTVILSSGNQPLLSGSMFTIVIATAGSLALVCILCTVLGTVILVIRVQKRKRRNKRKSKNDKGDHSLDNQTCK